MWITLSKKTEFLELEERRVWPWRVPENFLSISNVNSSLGSLSTMYMRCSTTEPRVSLKLEVKVCRIRWHMWVSLIVRGWGMWQPVLAVRDFYVDTLNDGSGVEVPISMSTTLSDSVCSCAAAACSKATRLGAVAPIQAICRLPQPLPAPSSSSNRCPLVVENRPWVVVQAVVLCQCPPLQRHQYFPPTLNHGKNYQIPLEYQNPVSDLTNTLVALNGQYATLLNISLYFQ